MVLHLALDEKFIDMAYNTFENVNPNNNKFIIVTSDKHEFTYIKKTPITKITKNKFFGKKFLDDLVKYELIIIHWLDSQKMKFILKCPKNIKILWIGWGGDYYSYMGKELLFAKTKELCFKNKDNTSMEKKIKSFIKRYLLFNKTPNMKNILERVDYFSPVLKVEYECLRKNFNMLSFPQYIDWNYGTLEDDLIIDDLTINGNNILLGNSATCENNHIEAIDILKNMDLKDRKIISPLSYGDNKYRDYIVTYGNLKLVKNFYPLENFMKINEYNKVISTCSIVIMNHLRQQALGNITIMMYFGAKVYLNIENPIYNFFKEQGAIIFSLKDLNDISINIELSDFEKNINREIIQKNWSRNMIDKKTKNILNIIKMENVNA